MFQRQFLVWLWLKEVLLALENQKIVIDFNYFPLTVGHGSMGICNSIGSNTFDILLCLGVPWLIKAVFFPIQPGQHFVGINSAGLEYSAITLLSTLFLLYITFTCNKFKLDRRVGTACLVMYLVFLTFASLIELNVFFRVNLPTCGRTWENLDHWNLKDESCG